MANLDINEGYSQAKSKISAYQTVKQSKEDDKKQQKEKTKASTDKKKSEVQKSINDLKKGGQDKKNQIKNEIKSQLEQLLELFKSTLPSGGGSSLKLLTNVFLQAATNTK
jgi:4-diphosphocytidyl-2C-methyl-D-erythritol kinase